MTSGAFIPILEKTRLDFSFLAGTASHTVTLRSNIDVIGYHYVQLFVRLHDRSMVSGQSLRFALVNSVPSNEDSRDFLDISSFLTADISDSTPAVPGITSGAASGPGPFLAFTVSATQTSVSSTFYVDASAVLLLRSGCQNR